MAKCIYVVIWNMTLGALENFAKGRRIYIQPDNIKLLEPRAGDFLRDGSEYWPYRSVRDFGVDSHIIERNNKPFIMPKAEPTPNKE